MSRIDLYERLFSRAIVRPNGCWEWAGDIWDKPPRNYGRLRYHGKPIRAHRAAYECCVADIPPGMLVTHLCNNPPCIRPDHLELGTQQDNVDYMVACGRRASTKGEAHGCAKLTADQVQQIRQLLREGQLTLAEIGRRFGIHVATVCDIKHKRTWTCVPEPEGIAA